MIELTLYLEHKIQIKMFYESCNLQSRIFLATRCLYGESASCYPLFHLPLTLHILQQDYNTHEAYVACDSSVSSDVVHLATLTVRSIDSTRVTMNMGHCNVNKKQGNNKLLGRIHVPVSFFIQ